MRSIPAALQSHLDSGVSTLATCWKLTRLDGAEFYFCDHDTDIVFDGRLYIAKSGLSRTALATNASLAVDNADLDGLLISEMMSAKDLRAGRFDYASLDIFLVNYTAPEQGRIRLQRGILGEVVLSERGMFHAELRGLTQALNQVAGEVYAPECRATLGDARCMVNLALLQQTGSVATVLDANGRRIFTTTGVAAAAGFFDFGLVVWETGDNAGASCEIVTWNPATAQCELFLPMGYRIQPGDTFIIYPGCDKRLETCKTKFDNVVNFRGFPHIPGMDKLMEYPLA
ncbi:MAG: DUF2163 domain-containing protein [Rhodospirillales bacterium]